VKESDLCEGSDNLIAGLSGVMTSLWVRVASARKVGLGYECSGEMRVSCTLSKCSVMQYSNTRFRKISDHLTVISIDVDDTCVLSVVFLRSLCMFTVCHVINTFSPAPFSKF
jgi:hypothetical protein